MVMLIIFTNFTLSDELFIPLTTYIIYYALVEYLFYDIQALFHLRISLII